MINYVLHSEGVVICGTCLYLEVDPGPGRVLGAQASATDAKRTPYTPSSTPSD